MSDIRNLTTTPRTPSSATMTFEPPPRIARRTRASWVAWTMASRSSTRRTSTSQSAGPPTRSVVSSASGAFRRTASGPTIAWRRASSGSVMKCTQQLFMNAVEPAVRHHYNQIALARLVRDGLYDLRHRTQMTGAMAVFDEIGDEFVNRQPLVFGERGAEN